MTNKEIRKLFYAKMVIHSIVAVAKFDNEFNNACKNSDTYHMELCERNIAIQLRNRRQWQENMD